MHSNVIIDPETQGFFSLNIITLALVHVSATNVQYLSVQIVQSKSDCELIQFQYPDSCFHTTQAGCT